jgi:hypothetical protein
MAAENNRDKNATGTRKRRRGPPEEEAFVRMDWTEHVRNMTPKKFRRRYRMDLGCFKEVVDAIRDQIQPFAVAHPRGEAIIAEIQLAATLRMLAGASYLDVADIFKMTESTVYSTMWRVVTAIVNTYKIEFPFNEEALLQIETEFRSRSEMEAMTGCVGCVDGLLIKIRQPSKSESHCSRRFHSRKGFYAINAQAVCDVHCRFMVFELAGGGAQSDVNVWKTLNFKKSLDDGNLKPGFWIAGDAAYPCTSYMIGPYSAIDTGADERKDNFNWSQSQLRIRIEMAFGQLVGRWGILWKPLRYDWRRASVLAMACAKLHNIIITYDLRHQQHYSNPQRRTAVSNPSDLVAENVEEMGRDSSRRRGTRRVTRCSAPVMQAPKFNKHGGPIENLNDCWYYAQSRATNHLRERLCRRVERLGVVRPATSSLARRRRNNAGQAAAEQR